MSIFSTFRNYRNSLSKKNEIIIFVFSIIFAFAMSAKAINDVKNGLHDVCNKKNVFECFFNTKVENVNINGESAKTNNESARKRFDFIKSESSRTRLFKLDQEYNVPFTVPFVDHSIIKMPVCIENRKPFFIFNSASKIDRQIEYKQSNGYWLFDVFSETKNGKVYTRPVLKDVTLTVTCMSPLVELKNK